MHKIYKLSFPYAHHENIIIVKIINAFIISQSFLSLFWIFLFYSFLQLPGNHFSATYHTHWSKFLELHANGKSILWIGFFFFFGYCELPELFWESCISFYWMNNCSLLQLRNFYFYGHKVLFFSHSTIGKYFGCLQFWASTSKVFRVSKMALRGKVLTFWPGDLNLICGTYLFKTRNSFLKVTLCPPYTHTTLNR